MNYTTKMCIWAGVMLISMMVGCTHGSNPLTPAFGGRGGQDYSANGSVLSAASGYIEKAVDQCVLGAYSYYGSGSGPSASGGPAAINLSGQTHYLTAVVSAVSTASGDNIQYAWLKDGVITPLQIGTVETASTVVQYGYPRCAAMIRPRPLSVYKEVYLAIAYQRRQYSNGQWGDWGVRVVFLH
jgi:hypothetical protein